jgi:hypothetical protein
MKNMTPPSMKNDVIANKKARRDSSSSRNRPSSNKALSWYNLDDDIWMNHILPFVGKNQYRFIGAVNRNFRVSYFTVFSPTTSYENVTTMEQAHLCCKDLDFDQRAALCKAMIKKGEPNIVKIAFAVNSDFYRFSQERQVQLTAAAAESGDFDLLRWLVEKNCEVDEEAFSGAALNGNLAMFQWLYDLPSLDFYRYSDDESDFSDDGHFNPPDVLSARRYVPWNYKIYENAALHGHLPIIEWALSKEKSPPQVGSMCSQAALNGHLHVLKWALSKNFAWDTSTASNAAKNGHLEILKWLHINGCRLNASACAKAAKNGHLLTLQWLRTNNCPWDDSTLFQVARFGHEEVAIWAQAQGCPLFSMDDLCDAVAEYGDLNMLKLAHSVLGFPLSSGIFWNAVFSGHLNILKWLHENQCPGDALSCQVAAEDGHFEVLKWLHKEGYNKLDGDTMSYAAEFGCIKMLQWLHANGCPWGDRTCAAAAGNGHLNVLKWLRDKGCPWDWTTYKLAILGDRQLGNLHVLEWAFANSCPPSGKICSVAAEYNHLDELKWARSHDIPWSGDVCSKAAENRNFEILDWAYANGCPFPDTYESLANAVRHDNEDVLAWFVKRNIGLNSETCAKAALEGDIEFFRWLHLAGCPWDKHSCANAAAKGHHEILTYARDNGCPCLEEDM